MERVRTLLCVAAFAAGGCGTTYNSSSGSSGGPPGKTPGGIRAAWFKSVSVRYCDNPTIGTYTSQPVAFGPATFVWSATCPDGTKLRCSGTPIRRGQSSLSRTTMEGDCREVAVVQRKAPTKAPQTAPPTPIDRLSGQEVLVVLRSAEVEVRACMGTSPPPRVEFSLQINGDGTAIYTGTEPPAPAEAAGCLRRLVSELRFRSTGAAPFDVNSPPLMFEQQEQPDAGTEPAPSP